MNAQSAIGVFFFFVMVLYVFYTLLRPERF